MRVVQVVSQLVTEASGPSYSVPRLSDNLSVFNIESIIFTTGATVVAQVQTFQTNLAQVPILEKLLFSRSLMAALDREAVAGSVLHAHGLWLMPNVYPARAALKHGSPLFYSPRGMLAPAALRYSPLKKRIFWKLAQKGALAAAACIHATSEEEVEDVRAAGLRNPIALIPNGIDLPEETPASFVKDPPTILHLGRLHPKKGIDRLITAWARVEQEFPTWRLRIVGPSEVGYLGELKRQAAQFGLKRVVFEGPLFGENKIAAYRQAEFFVLPTLSENFGIVVAEALAAGTPVISTKGAPWAGLDVEGCGWWVDHGPEPLEAALREAMTRTRESRAQMGARGRAWMARDFSWASVARDMAGAYRWATGKGEAPPCLIKE